MIRFKQQKKYPDPICAGDPILFTITPFSATATYTFKVNGGIVQSLAGVNTVTFSSNGGVGSIADGDIVTMDIIDSNGCIPIHQLFQLLYLYQAYLIPGLSASASDGLFCSGETINFTHQEVLVINGISMVMNNLDQHFLLLIKYYQMVILLKLEFIMQTGCFDESH